MNFKYLLLFIVANYSFSFAQTKEDYVKAYNMMIYPQESSILYSRAIREYKMGNYIDAMTLVDEAIKKSWQNDQAYELRAEMFDKLGEYNNSINDYTSAIDIGGHSNDRRAHLYMNRGIVYSSLQQYNNAINDFTEAIKNDDEFWGAYTNRGVAYYNLGKYKIAIDDYSRAINLNTNHDISYVNRGIAKELIGLPCCNDIKKGCDLGNEEGCRIYKKHCK